MTQTQIEQQTVPDAGSCHVCHLLASAPSESVVYETDLWTATLALDVPGWLLVAANRHNQDWSWGLSDQEAATLGPLVRLLSATARAEAGAERVYLMGVGENQRHFHFLLLSRSATMPPEMRGTGILVHTPELTDRNQAFRVGARMRDRLSRSVVLDDERR